MPRTFADLQNEALGNDFDSQTYRPLVKTWINEALRRVARRVQLPELEATAAIAVVAGTNQYALPADEVRDLSLREPSTATPLAEIEIGSFDELEPSSGKPRLYARFGGFLFLHPTPEAAYALELRYTRQTIELTGDSETPDIPDDYADALVSYARSRAFRMEDDRQQAEAFMNDFDRAIVELRADVGRRGRPTRQIPSMWSAGSSPNFVRPG